MRFELYFFYAVPPIITAELAMLPMMNTVWFAARLFGPTSWNGVKTEVAKTVPKKQKV